MVSTHEDIVDAIADGAHTVEQIGARCGAGTGCGACREYIDEMIDELGAGCTERCRECPRAEPLLTIGAGTLEAA